MADDYTSNVIDAAVHAAFETMGLDVETHMDLAERLNNHLTQVCGHTIKQEHLEEKLDTAEGAFAINPCMITASAYLTALLAAEAEGYITDDGFRDGIVAVRDWLKQPTGNPQ